MGFEDKVLAQLAGAIGKRGLAKETVILNSLKLKIIKDGIRANMDLLQMVAGHDPNLARNVIKKLLNL